MDGGLFIGPDGEPDRYRLLRSIGRGGEAVLYLAELELGGATEPVVVKMLDARHTLAPDLFARVSAKWREQAELLRFVHRPGVVGIREHFEGPSAHPGGQLPAAGGRALYLVMNHVEGLDLRDWRAERTLESPAERREAVRCLEQLAEVLDWLHSGAATPSGRQVVHGDLSPGNVMVDGHGQATLVDFGLSKLAAEHRTAEVWFTPGFAAPEVFDGIRSPATDRYAFGAIAYFLLSGNAPAPVPETLRAALLALPELSGAGPEQAARIAAVFAVDPRARPASLTGWVRELRSYVVSATRPPVANPPLAGAPLTGPPPARPPLAGPPLTRPEQAPAPPAVPPAPVPPPPGHAPQPVFLTPPPQPAPAPVARRGRGLRVALAAVVAVALLGGGVALGVALGGGKGDPAAGDAPASRSASHTATAPPPSGPATAQDSAGDGTGDGTGDSGDSAGDTSGSTAGDQGDAPAGETSLADLKPTDESLFTLERGTASVDGVRYDDALKTTYCYGATAGYDGFAEYNLGRSYKKLTFTVGLDDNSPDTGKTFTVLADGKRLFRQRVTVGHPAQPSLDVSGVLRLRVEWLSDDQDSSCPIGVLGNPTLTP